MTPKGKAKGAAKRPLAIANGGEEDDIGNGGSPPQTQKRGKVDPNSASAKAWKKAAECKANIDKHMATAGVVKRAIEIDPSWAWAKKMDEYPLMCDKMQAMEKLQAQRLFWQELAFAKTASDLKKKGFATSIATELESHSAAALEHSKAACHAAEIIKAMHNARPKR